MIKQIIQEKTLKADQTACQNILKKIVDEKGNEELEKIWHLANREEIRTKLSQRKEINIQREIDAGIKKNYVHVSALVKQQNARFSNSKSKTDRQMVTRDTFKKDETIYSINCKNQNDDQTKPTITVSPNNDKVTAQTLNQNSQEQIISSLVESPVNV